MPLKKKLNVTWMLQPDICMLHECYVNVTQMLRECYVNVTCMLHECYSNVKKSDIWVTSFFVKMLPKCYMNVRQDVKDVTLVTSFTIKCYIPRTLLIMA